LVLFFAGSGPITVTSGNLGVPGAPPGPEGEPVPPGPLVPIVDRLNGELGGAPKLEAPGFGKAKLSLGDGIEKSGEGKLDADEFPG